ncbi:MAG: MetQ/NlpA family ABC transporter substrate-binding protein [Lachnospiraceae bacterium]|nr:MetQ/NlpA family ABC transporter substrate-binding protein [Lachnospiraceae bacterium]
MKKKVLSAVLAVSLLATLFTGCSAKGKDSAKSDKSSDDTTIKVGACVTPHAEILEAIKDDLKEQGYDLEVVTYNDYVLPNTALESGELDANYFQHKPYLEDFNKENGTHIVGVAAVHFEPMAIYAGKTASLDEVKDGAIVAIPNDTTNEARALLLLEAQGLIKLKEGAGIQATVADIEENPHNLTIQELEAAQVAKSIQDVDFAVINGNYALGAGLTESIAVEASDSLAAETYANYVCVREGEEKSPKTEALVKAILSDKVRDYINDNYKGAVVPVF